MGDENGLKLIVLVAAQLCECTKKHQIVYFKWANCMVCEFSLNKTVIWGKKKKKISRNLAMKPNNLSQSSSPTSAASDCYAAFRTSSAFCQCPLPDSSPLPTPHPSSHDDPNVLFFTVFQTSLLSHVTVSLVSTHTLFPATLSPNLQS